MPSPGVIQTQREGFGDMYVYCESSARKVVSLSR